MSSPELIDATEMADQYKSTFELPEIEMLQEVDVDWILKVCDGRERFWTSVVSIKRDNNIFDTEITAKIDNHLVYSKEYNYGDTIKYKLRNVYSVKRPASERVEKVVNMLRELGMNQDQIGLFLLYNMDKI